MWGRSGASEGARKWESMAGGGLPVRGLIKRGEEGREKERDCFFFIFTREAYLMIFPQTDRQADRERDRQDTLEV